jgi:hypothetical protein
MGERVPVKQAEPTRQADNHVQTGAGAQRRAFVDNRPEAVAQRRLQEMMDNSPQAVKGRALQAMMNNSAQAREGRALQAMMNNSSRAREVQAFQRMANSGARANPPLQRVEDDEPLQAKAATEHAVQLETAAEVPKPNNTGLPDNLKSGIESLSGMSMDHVKVHYNSSQPTQLNALAYAQGSDIHVAPGQETHLPHEAWHVVQQAQGRVRPTMQLAGADVNEDRGLEAEADRMGEVARRAGEAGQTGKGGDLALSGVAPVLQRTVAQISLLPGDAPVVADVNIVGRPPPTFSGSMGDHSTAFAVQVAGVRRRIMGRSLENAVLGMDELVAELGDLPGYALVINLPGMQRDRFLEAEARLGALRARLPSALVLRGQAQSLHAIDLTQVPLILQDLIAVYLEVRELVPLSTTNVKAVAPAQAGKGKGEAGWRDVLQRAESGGSVARGDLQVAFLGMFDIASAAMVGAETDAETLAALSPGLPAEVGFVERVRQMALQHFLAVRSAFPLAVAAAFESMDVAVNALVQLVLPKLVGEWQETLLAIPKWLERNNEFIVNAQSELVHLNKRAVKRRQGYEEEISRLNADNIQLGEQQKYLSKLVQDHSPKESDGMELEPASGAGDRLRPITGGGGQAEVADEHEEENEEESEEAKEEARSPLATQIRLGGDGRITALEFAGRTVSPFSNTMGAHTTSWVVHLDQLRARLTGRTMQQAVDLIRNSLIPEAQAAGNGLKDFFKMDSRHQALFEQAQQALVSALDACLSGPEVGKALQLQRLIGAYLAYVNLQPGATRDVSATGGRGEGRLRGLLNRYEQGVREGVPPGELAGAIAGLFDVGNEDDHLSNHDAIRTLWKHHLAVVAVAYPNAFVASKISENLGKDPIQTLSKLTPKAKKGGTGKKVNMAPLAPHPLEGVALIDPQGGILPEAQHRFIAAYRRDVALSNAYLNEADGHIIANTLGIGVHVFQDAVPDGFRAVDLGGGGNCLIHALVGAWAVLQGNPARGATPDEIGRLRMAVAGGLNANDVLASAAAAVFAQMIGAGEFGLGPNMRALLGSPSIQKAKKDFKEAPSSGKSISGKSVSRKSWDGGDMEQDGGGGLIQLGNPNVAQDVAVLHTGGNHYVLLIRR